MRGAAVHDTATTHSCSLSVTSLNHLEWTPSRSVTKQTSTLRGAGHSLKTLHRTRAGSRTITKPAHTHLHTSPEKHALM